MENSELQSTYALINRIKFEEKIDIDDLVFVWEVAVEVTVGELSPNVLVSKISLLPNGFVDLSSVIPVNVIEIKYITFGYESHII